MELTNWRKAGGQSSYNKEWADYCKTTAEMSNIILKRLLECGGTTGQLQGHFEKGGQKASQEYIIKTIGELEGNMLITQWNGIVKPKFKAND